MICYLTTHPSPIICMLWKLYPRHIQPQIPDSPVLQAPILGLQVQAIVSCPLCCRGSVPRGMAEGAGLLSPSQVHIYRAEILLQAQQTENTRTPYFPSSACSPIRQKFKGQVLLLPKYQYPLIEQRCHSR